MRSKRKPKPFSRENVLSPDERNRILKACETYEERLVIFGLLYTGMRESEFLHMKKAWMDFDNNIINLPYKDTCNICSSCKKSKSRRGKLIKPPNTWQSKTKHAERTVPIVPEVEKIFKDYFSAYNSIIDVLWYRQNIWKIVREVGKRALIKHPVFPHCLRATFATILVEKGLDDSVTLKDLLGWKKLDMATSYIKLGGVAMKKRIDKIW